MVISRSSLVLALAGALAGLLLLLSAPQADAAYSTCRLASSDQQPRSGKPTYNLRLQEDGTDCTTAKRVMRGYHACRSRTSVNCRGRVVSRWRCTGRKGASSDTQFDATFTCTAGRDKVRGTFQQNT
jgi:hypothetical protein